MRPPERRQLLVGEKTAAGHRLSFSNFEIVGGYKEKASGAKTDRIERKKVMALAQAREIDAILVTELSRWGRSTIDLVQTLQTLQTLQAWDVSVLAISGLQFDLSTPHGRMIASVMAAQPTVTLNRLQTQGLIEFSDGAWFPI